ncbi:MAG: outer membrane protein, partial [Beijerinckiaceae bacterium]
MDQLKSIALAGAMMILAPVAASAADMGRPPMHLPPPPIAAPIAEASGWYLRGDVGIGVLDAKPEIVDARFAPPVVGTHDPSFSTQGFIGIGAGYQFNNWLRADVTAELRGSTEAKFTDKYCFGSIGGAGIARPGSACGNTTGFTGSDGRNLYTGRINTNLFMANGYVDLGTWNGLTPYLGVGVGVANHRVEGLTDQGTANNYAGGALTFTSVATPVNYAEKSQTNLAWALMAGVAYDVSQSLKLELGYRYLNMGDIKGIQT